MLNSAQRYYLRQIKENTDLRVPDRCEEPRAYTAKTHQFVEGEAGLFILPGGRWLCGHIIGQQAPSSTGQFVNLTRVTSSFAGAVDEPIDGTRLHLCYNNTLACNRGIVSFHALEWCLINSLEDLLHNERVFTGLDQFEEPALSPPIAPLNFNLSPSPVQAAPHPGDLGPPPAGHLPAAPKVAGPQAFPKAPELPKAVPGIPNIQGNNIQGGLSPTATEVWGPAHTPHRSVSGSPVSVIPAGVATTPHSFAPAGAHLPQTPFYNSHGTPYPKAAAPVGLPPSYPPQGFHYGYYQHQHAPQAGAPVGGFAAAAGGGNPYAHFSHHHNYQHYGYPPHQFPTQIGVPVNGYTAAGGGGNPGGGGSDDSSDENRKKKSKKEKKDKKDKKEKKDKKDKKEKKVSKKTSAKFDQTNVLVTSDSGGDQKKKSKKDKKEKDSKKSRKSKKKGPGGGGGTSPSSGSSTSGSSESSFNASDIETYYQDHTSGELVAKKDKFNEKSCRIPCRVFGPPGGLQIPALSFTTVNTVDISTHHAIRHFNNKWPGALAASFINEQRILSGRGSATYFQDLREIRLEEFLISDLRSNTEKIEPRDLGEFLTLSKILQCVLQDDTVSKNHLLDVLVQRLKTLTAVIKCTTDKKKRWGELKRGELVVYGDSTGAFTVGEKR